KVILITHPCSAPEALRLHWGRGSGLENPAAQFGLADRDTKHWLDLFQPGVPRGYLRDGGPVEGFASTRQQAKKAVADDVPPVEPNTQRVGSLERQADILQCQGSDESSGMELLFDHQVAVSLVNRSIKQGGGEEFKILALINFAFADQSESFAE